MNFTPTGSPQMDASSVTIDWLVQFYNSPFVLVLKILIGIYVLVLLADVIMLLILRDVPSHFRTGMRGQDIPLISKRKMSKRWEKIKSRLSSGDVSQYKLAIIEADAVADEILAGLGYHGQNMAERFDQMEATHIDSHYDTLKDAHSIRNRVVNEVDFPMDQKTADSVIAMYENFLKYLDYLD